jgi:hypothetical protein|nr:hypothetical protein [Pseudomonas oleovorans]
MVDMFEEGERDGREQGAQLDAYKLFTRGDEYACGFVWGYTDRMVGFVAADVFWSLLGENAREARAPLDMLLEHVEDEYVDDVKRGYHDS